MQGGIIKKCAKCGKEINGVPAISRKDNKTELCSLCGNREALEIIGMDDEHINKIINKIKKIELLV